ncbi:hypothetical protein EHO65_17110 [Leptospira andrefontaineae]|uniref:Uncharacterized protein n=1 Tax=Leptospira andrefontaineae TaxID=2484976 RepID=A0A4R9GXV7_9LEPT|nr:hypothetical protein EHO65_17110 [Leptospira andrefontaineae]
MGDKNHIKRFIRTLCKYGQKFWKIFPIICDFASNQTTKQKILSKERNFSVITKANIAFSLILVDISHFGEFYIFRLKKEGEVHL